MRRREARRTFLRRLGVVGAIVLVVIVAAVGLRAAFGPGDARDDQRGSALVRARGSLLVPTDEPAAYEIVYRSVETATDAPVTTTEHIRVRRPFDARIQIRQGEPPGGEQTAERVTRFGVLGTPDGQGKWTLFAVPPAVAGSDMRSAPVLEQAVADGLVQVRERRRVIGRECQVYRAGGVASGGNLVPYDGGSKEYADICIDRRGLLLEEIWAQKGKRLVRKVATSVDEHAALPDRLFAPKNAEELSFADGGGSVKAVDPTSRPSGADFWELEAPPEGFQYRGRYSIIPARLDPFRQSLEPSEETRGTASVADVWVRGPDLLVIDQGVVTAPTGKLEDSPHATKVDLGPLGEGTRFADFRASEVRAQRPDRGFLRVYGTLALDDLVAITRSLHPVPGTELRFLED